MGKYFEENEYPPFEIFERIADERIEEYAEPKIKGMRADIRQVRKSQDVLSAEFSAFRDSIRTEMRAEIEAVRTFQQKNIDSLVRQIAQLKIDHQITRMWTAIALMKESMSTAINSFTVPEASKELIIRKYESATTEIPYAEEPFEVSNKFIRFCIEVASGAGFEVIDPGLKQLSS